jgi:hypothetical protein
LALIGAVDGAAAPGSICEPLSVCDMTIVRNWPLSPAQLASSIKGALAPFAAVIVCSVVSAALAPGWPSVM